MDTTSLITSIHDLSLEGIDPLNSPTRPRGEAPSRDERVINSYRSQMEAGNWDFRDPSAIVLFQDDRGQTWIGRGHYVIAALQSLGIKGAAVTIHEGTKEDAMIFAASDSRLHENRTKRDRHQAAKMLLTAWATQFATEFDENGSPILSLDNIPWTEGRPKDGEPIYSLREVARRVGFASPEAIQQDYDILNGSWRSLTPEEEEFLLDEFPVGEVAECPEGRGTVIRHDPELGPIIELANGRTASPKLSLKSVEQRPNAPEPAVVPVESLEERVAEVERQLERRVAIAEDRSRRMFEAAFKSLGTGETMDEAIDQYKQGNPAAELLAKVHDSMRQLGNLDKAEARELLAQSLEYRDLSPSEFFQNEKKQ